MVTVKVQKGGRGAGNQPPFISNRINPLVLSRVGTREQVIEIQYRAPGGETDAHEVTGVPAGSGASQVLLGVIDGYRNPAVEALSPLGEEPPRSEAMEAELKKKKDVDEQVLLQASDRQRRTTTDHNHALAFTQVGHAVSITLAWTTYLTVLAPTTLPRSGQPIPKRDELYFKYHSAEKTKRKKRAKIKGDYGPEEDRVRSPPPKKKKNRCGHGVLLLQDQDDARSSPSFLPKKQESAITCLSTAASSPEAMEEPLHETPLLSGPLGRLATSSMAATLKEPPTNMMRGPKLCAAAAVPPILQTAPAPPPPLLHPTSGYYGSLSFDSSSSTANSRVPQHSPKSRGGGETVIRPFDCPLQTSKEEELRKIVAACNHQLSEDAAQLRSEGYKRILHNHGYHRGEGRPR